MIKILYYYPKIINKTLGYINYFSYIYSIIKTNKKMVNEQHLQMWLKLKLAETIKQKDTTIDILNDPHYPMSIEKHKMLEEQIEYSEFRINWLNTQISNLNK